MAIVAVVALVVLAGCAGTPGPSGGNDTGANGTTDGAADENGTTDGAGGANASDGGNESATAADNQSGGEVTATFVTNGTEQATLTLETAVTDEEQKRGLMGRESLAADGGMLFVFDSAEPRSFWMKNTLIPLDMIFVGPDGTVLNVEHASPEPNASDSDLERYESDGDAQYVIETNRGFANETGIGPGTTVEFEGLNASTSAADDAAADADNGTAGNGTAADDGTAERLSTGVDVDPAAADAT
jgi:hypothetical protein